MLGTRLPPGRQSRRRRARARGRALVLCLTALLLLVTGNPIADASRGSDPFVPGSRYSGDFPDPWIMRAGDTYYAYSTNTANLNLPTLRSKDLQTWVAVGDTMPSAAGWASRVRASGRWVSRTWAPSVTWVAKGAGGAGGHFVAAYTVPRGGKNCISLAVASSPTGPFRDGSSGPIVCPSDQGAIDPQVYIAGNGVPWLIWKTEGRPGCCPTRLWSRQLTADGTSFAEGSSDNALLTTALSWEGNVTENPAMIRVNGLLFLFYSANEYVDGRYAIGYAVCESVSGPCRRPSTLPLMATGGAVSGPGGPAPFMGPDGQLKLGYAAWSYGRTGYPRSSRCRPNCNQRRLHVASLRITSDGLLQVTDRG